MRCGGWGLETRLQNAENCVFKEPKYRSLDGEATECRLCDFFVPWWVVRSMLAKGVMGAPYKMIACWIHLITGISEKTRRELTRTQTRNRKLVALWYMHVWSEFWTNKSLGRTLCVDKAIYEWIVRTVFECTELRYTICKMSAPEDFLQVYGARYKMVYL